MGAFGLTADLNDHVTLTGGLHLAADLDLVAGDDITLRRTHVGHRTDPDLLSAGAGVAGRRCREHVLGRRGELGSPIACVPRLHPGLPAAPPVRVGGVNPVVAALPRFAPKDRDLSVGRTGELPAQARVIAEANRAFRGDRCLLRGFRRGSSRATPMVVAAVAGRSASANARLRRMRRVRIERLTVLSIPPGTPGPHARSLLERVPGQAAVSHGGWIALFASEARGEHVFYE